MSGNKINKVVLIVAGVVAVGFLGLAVALHRNTLVAWWKPVGICALLAVWVGAALRVVACRLSGVRNAIAGFAMMAAAVFSISIGAFYGLNYFGADAGSGHKCTTVVVDKFSEEHHRTRRVGRRVVGRGEKYKVYYIVVEFPDGRTKRMSVSTADYVRMRKGRELELAIESGLLGVPVIKSLEIPVYKSTRF